MNNSPLKVGNNVMIRTVTFFYTGRIDEITETEIVLVEAAWVADTGRWHDALKTGALNEVEPFVDPVSISRVAIVDVTRWGHELPHAVQ